MGMDVYGKSGNYFRAGSPAWEAICSVIERATGQAVPQDWYYNEGDGLDNADACWAMAESLDKFLAQTDEDVFGLPAGVIPRPSPLDFVLVQLAEQGVDMSTVVHAPNETCREHLQEFISFLRGCGEGFEIH